MIRGLAPVMSQVPSPPAPTISVGRPRRSNSSASSISSALASCAFCDPQLAVGLEHAVPLVSERPQQPQAGGVARPARPGRPRRRRCAPPSGAGRRRARRARRSRSRRSRAASASSSALASLSTRTMTLARPARRASSAALTGPTTWLQTRMSDEPGSDHRRRLPDGRGCEPDRARVDLHPPELRALVDLRVRAQGGGHRLHAPRHLGDVVADHGELDQQRRGRHGARRAADQPARGVERCRRPCVGPI